MLNKWCGQGRLTRDIELNYTSGNVPVASFTIACDRDYTPRDGDKQCDFIDVVAWRKSAEFVSKYFHKGDMIIVSGRLQTRSYEDKNGVRRKIAEINAESFNFGGSKRDGGNNHQTSDGSDQPPYGVGQDFSDDFYPVSDMDPASNPFEQYQ